jgi:alanyl aminopeptidase
VKTTTRAQGQRSKRILTPATLATLAALAACGGPPAPSLTTASSPSSVAAPRDSAPLSTADQTPPLVRLPSDVRPTGESLRLRIVPDEDRFSGVADIAVELSTARPVVWIHGRGLHATRVSVTPEGKPEQDARWEQKTESGVVAITPTAGGAPFAAGKAKLHIEYDAPFETSLKGLYRVKQSGRAYAFTQFEAIAARQAFPCFDEPSFKIPFSLTLTVPESAVAVANNPEASPPAVSGGFKTVTFKTTPPLPSYLVAFAVGPLDVVDAPDVPASAVRKRPLPLRGITAKGRGPEMKYALAHTGEILATLEKYFGVEYPYDKLDILAVPDKGGAMENPGAITFREYLLLMDEKTAPIGQRRAFAGVMAHELAHMWFGDLVTMSWWDDTWLNEAFATWMGNKAADLWDPRTHAELGLLGGVQGAMGVDSLVSARAIRQPVTTSHDIENSFDSITYQKGGGVLSMFERWLGAYAFQKGVRTYLDLHRFGNAGADDFLSALSQAAGKDVKAAFHTFLDQPGVPFVETALECSAAGDGKSGSNGKPNAPRIRLTQSRYLPVGSAGDAAKTWQVPICARYGVGEGGKEIKESCTLLTEREGTLPLDTESCPTWVFPNANGAGYFRFAMAPADLAALRKTNLAGLSTREKIAYGNGLRAAFNRATTPAKEVIAAEAPLARDSHPEVAHEPMGFISMAHDWLYADPLRPKVEAYGRSLYDTTAKGLGWEPAKGEDEDRAVLRQSVMSFLATTARDASVRAEAKRRGHAYVGFKKDGAIHRDAVDANLAGLALAVAGEEADQAFFDALLAALAKTEDDALRGRLLTALGSAKSPELAARARELAIDPRLRVTEVGRTLAAQLDAPETREAAWRWMKDHYDALAERMSHHHGGVRLIAMARVFCDESHANDAETFFAKRVDGIEGGPRVLASTLEDVRLCAAKKKAQEPSLREMFSGKK